MKISLTLGVLLTMATAHASLAIADPVSDCRAAMAVRPMPPVAGSAIANPGGWGDVYVRAIQGSEQRRAAIALCETDPYAHLKPLPWEGAPVARSPGAVCFVQGAVLVCP